MLLYAFLPLQDEATALKYDKKVPMKHLYLSPLASYNFCCKVIACICRVNMVKIVLIRQRSSSDKRWGSESRCKGLGEQRSPVWQYNIPVHICNVIVHNHMILSVI